MPALGRAAPAAVPAVPAAARAPVAPPWPPPPPCAAVLRLQCRAPCGAPAAPRTDPSTGPLQRAIRRRGWQPSARGLSTRSVRSLAPRLAPPAGHMAPTVARHLAPARVLLAVGDEATDWSKSAIERVDMTLSVRCVIIVSVTQCIALGGSSPSGRNDHLQRTSSAPESVYFASFHMRAASTQITHPRYPLFGSDRCCDV